MKINVTFEDMEWVLLDLYRFNIARYMGLTHAEPNVDSELLFVEPKFAFRAYELYEDSDFWNTLIDRAANAK